MSDTFLSDAPATEDAFGRKPFADRIAAAIRSRKDPDPLVIGIYGPWGDGKSTVLNFIQAALAGDDGVIVVKFNPWRFRSEDELLPYFFVTLADALGKSLKDKVQRAGAAVLRYAKYFRPVSKVAEAFTGLDAAGVVEQAATDFSASDLEADKEKVGQLLKESGKRVVVLMDDIDRLDRAEIHAVFKMIKLSADFPNTVYVLAFDDEMVAASLGSAYASGGVEGGREFLEKIVQVPLHLSRIPPTRLHRYLLDMISQAIPAELFRLTDDEPKVFEAMVASAFQARMHTPRMCKRYVNAIHFVLGLLGDQVNRLDLVLLEGLRLFYPGVYDVVRAHRTISLGAALFVNSNEVSSAVRDQGKELFDSATAHYTSVEKDAAGRLLRAVLPYFGIGEAHKDASASRKQDAVNRRLRSPDHFDTYFSYAGPPRLAVTLQPPDKQA